MHFQMKEISTFLYILCYPRSCMLSISYGSSALLLKADKDEQL